jgi:predicted nucleic acid-binding protein
MSVRSFVDTNVLVYLFDADAPEKQARARELLAARGPAGELVISTQVLQEFFVTVTRKLEHPLSTESAEQAVRRLAAYPVVTITVGLVLAAIAVLRAHQISFWDALIVAAAREAGCSELLSEDLGDGANLAGLRVSNPFRENPAS